MSTTTIEYVVFEEPPFSRVEPGAVTSQYADLPESFLEALSDLYAQVDGTACARCGNSVGFTLSGDRDETVNWEPVGLARCGGGPVSVQCANCAPWLPELD